MKSVLFFLFSLFNAIAFAQPVSNTVEPNNAPASKSEDKSLKNKEVLDSMLYKQSTQKTKAEKVEMEEQQMDEKKSSFSKTKMAVQTQRTQKNPSPQQQEVLNQTVAYYAKNAPNSFEYHYFKYLAGNYDFSLIQHLKEAEKLKPENVEVSIQFVAYHYLQNDTANAALYLKKLVDKKRLSESLLFYAQDVLTSIDENNTLVTHGVDDTYAALYWQLCKKYRTDVRIVSLDFLQAKAEINHLKKEKFNLPDQILIDTNYFKQFVTSNPQRSFAIALTLPKEYLKTIASNLHVHGLVFSYAGQANTKDFFHCEYLWDQKLNKKVINEPYSEQAKNLSSNYLPMLFLMRKVYKSQNQEEKFKEMEFIIDKISIQSQKNKEVDTVRKKF